MHRLLRLAASLAAALVGAAPLGAQCADQKLLAPDGEDWDELATCVDLDGPSVALGCRLDDDLGPDAGAVHVYDLDAQGWTPRAKLFAPDGGPGDAFGFALALEAGRILVGVPGDDEAGLDAGAAWVFERGPGGWAPVAKLLAADADPGDAFGTSVDLAGDVALVGAFLDDERALDAGAAYVFRRSAGAWTQEAKLAPAELAAQDWFGINVAADPERLAVGWPQDDDVGVDGGAVLVVDRVAGAWLAAAKLTASDGGEFDNFGRNLDLDGDRLFVGAPGDDELDFNSGAAFVFDRGPGGWAESEKLVPGTLGFADRMGWSVALEGDLAVAAAVGDDDGGSGAGCVYVFQRGAQGWGSPLKVLAADPMPGQFFGRWTALEGGALLVGAPGDSQAGQEAGAAYLFPATCPGEVYCAGDGSAAACPCGNAGQPGAGCESSFGTGGGRLFALGAATLADDGLALYAWELPPTTVALFFQGDARVAQGAGAPFGDGLRCVQGTIVRLATRPVTGGTTSLGGRAGEPSVSALGQVPATGALRHYQVWYRNVASFCTAAAFNLTNGLSLSWTP